MPKSGKKGTFGCNKDGPRAPMQSTNAVARHNPRKESHDSEMIKFLNQLRNSMQNTNNNVKDLQNNFANFTDEKKLSDDEMRVQSSQYEQVNQRLDNFDTKLNSMEPTKPFDDKPLIDDITQVKNTVQLLMSSVNAATKSVDDISDRVASRAELRILDDRVKVLSSKADDSNLAAKVRALSSQMGNLGKSITPEVTETVMQQVRDELAKSASGFRSQSRSLESTTVNTVMTRLNSALEGHTVITRLREDLNGFAKVEDLNGFAKVEDLNGFAKVEDLNGLPSQNEVNMLKSVIDNLVTELTQQKKLIIELQKNSKTVPVEAPVEVPVEVPVEAPVEVPVEAPGKKSKKSKKGRK